MPDPQRRRPSCRFGLTTGRWYHSDRLSVRIQAGSDSLHRSTSALRWYIPWYEKTDSQPHRLALDRKSTRLNSSHVRISYAVFCLKKKKKKLKTDIIKITKTKMNTIQYYR